MNSQGGLEQPVIKRESILLHPSLLFIGPVLEGVGQGAGLNGRIPEPLDLFNHTGNLWVGSSLAILSTAGAIAVSNLSTESIKTLDFNIQEEKFSRTRKLAFGLAVGSTALVNCITETKWGVTHLPIANALGGPVPDVIDTAYSTGFASILTWFGWRKIRSPLTRYKGLEKHRT